ncbi:MAG: lytic transglycosylase domain-containing protein [Bacteroidaceae bacterium]|nr:lytic transglycosylase domain-containing protein [Bacteroidaceae bacterium]
MKNRTRISPFIILTSIICTAILLLSNKEYEQPENNQAQRTMQDVFPPEIPSRVVFADDTIDLTLQERRERMDKEMLSFAYSHINTMLIIKRANRLFPIVEPILRECGVPDDFKYLMIIECNGDPEAFSPSKAGGLWQFLEKTGREYGLEVTDEIDERYHTEKATRAACKYLKDSYEIYGDWLTVAASYNTGRANVTKRIERQKEKKAIDLVLPNETSRYIFRLMAVKTIFANPAKYGFVLHSSDLYPAIPIEKEVTVKDLTLDWADFAKKHGLTFLQLREANHWIRRTTLNNKTGKSYKVQIPDKNALRYNPADTKAHNPMWVID